MSPVREIVIVTPALGEDLYAVHQQVWEGVSPWLSSAQRQRFVFAPESPQASRRNDGIWRVRSQHLPAHGTSLAGLPPSGRMHVTLAATRTEQHREVEIKEADQQAWAAALLARNGFIVSACTVTARWVAEGNKRSTAQRIRIPAVRVALDYNIGSPALACAAFVQGVGRGKRFGFGMLRIDA